HTGSRIKDRTLLKDGGVRNGDSVNEDTCRPPQNSVDGMENACDIALFIDGHDAGRVMGAGIFCRWWYHFALMPAQKRSAALRVRSDSSDGSTSGNHSWRVLGDALANAWVVLSIWIRL